MHGMEFVVFLFFGILILPNCYLYTLWKSAKGSPNLARNLGFLLRKNNRFSNTV